MPINITMPALSPTMEEGSLAKWHVKLGDQVNPGDVIAEIETDKATMEVEAVDEGIVAKILVDAGAENVKVNSIIAILAEPGEDPKQLNSITLAPPEKPKSEPSANKRGAAPKSDLETGQTAPAVKSTPGTAYGERVFASPLAKRIAREQGLDLSGIKGSGPRGRIVKADLETVGVKKARHSSEAASSPDGIIVPQILDDRIYPPDSYRLQPLDGMRRTVARRLTESFMQVPHFPLNVDLRIDRLLNARSSINANAPDGVKVSVNDFLIKAAAHALMAEPDCNASYSDNGIAYHTSAHISVAVAIDGGLLTPVIRDAQTKGLRQISEEMRDLAARARDRKLAPQEYLGGTFSISNLGMFGVKSFGSIINPPEGMILSVGSGEKRPIIDADGNLSAATVMSVTLSCDHRVIGGAEGARWLQAFKRFVETPESMLL